MRQLQQDVVVRVQREPGTEDLPLPSYATSGSAGLDLCAAIPCDDPLTLNPGERKLISTGIRIGLPDGYEGQVRPRSGLALQHGVGMVNSPGTIDSDYRGVIQVLLINLGQVAVTLRRGDRIAQLVVSPVARAEMRLVDELEMTDRGEGGFGSTDPGA